MTALQIKLAANHIISTYYYLTIDEVRKMLADGITLKYGPIYDRFDVSVLSEWCEKFITERSEAHKRVEAYENGTKNIYDLFQNDTMKKILGETMAEIEKRNSGKLSRVAEGKKMKQSEFEQFIIRSWDKYRKRYGTPERGKEFKGRFVDFASFAEHKYAQLQRVSEYYSNGSLI